MNWNPTAYPMIESRLNMDRSAACIIAALLISSCLSLLAQSKRVLTATDCVEVHYLPSDDPYRSSIVINPQGDEVAYLLKEPNLRTNENDIALYIRPLTTSAQAASTRLAIDPDIAQLTWIHNGRTIVFLQRYHGHVAIMQANIDTRKMTPLFTTNDDIAEYTIARDADVLAYSTNIPVHDIGHLSHTPEEITSGYRIPFQEQTNLARRKRTLHLVKRQADGRWGVPRDITIRSPFSNENKRVLPYLFHHSLSISPDGRKLAITYPESTSALPRKWQEDPTVHQLVGMVQELYVMVLYNVETGQTSFPLQSPTVYSIPEWEQRSHTFIVNADPPLDSKWHQEESGRSIFFTPHMFSFNTDTGETKELLSRVTNMYEGALALPQSGEAILRVSKDEIAHYIEDDFGWKEQSRFRIPVQNIYRLAQVASNGVHTVGDSQSTSNPPALFLYRQGDTSVTVFAKLNPQFDNLTLASVKNVSWTTSTGDNITGLLFEPPDYREGQAYPLVIHTKLELGQFLCDTGDSHYPSFAPQPLANAGIMYLIRSWPEGKGPGDDVPFYPKGYPGGIAEAAFQMDIWDSAVKSLVASGVVDSDKIGIIGFSRTGWYTEFMLEHSSIPFRAATVTDNVTYSLGAYSLVRNEASNRVAETIYGGPPYGASLEAWRRYSSTFNVDKIKTPVLMEEMGYGQKYDNVNAPPLWLSMHFELFTALNRLHKPVELYYYPQEDHQPAHPKARLATLQRNVDWYRFWLQGYERPGEDIAEQYNRWKMMECASLISKCQQ